MGRAAAIQTRSTLAERLERPRTREKSEGIVPTVREFLPWHVLEKKLAARAALTGGAQPEPASMDDGCEELDLVDAPEPPDSGVRATDRHVLGEDVLAAVDGGLSFKVYTLAELEARGISADVSARSTRMSSALMASTPRPWADVAKAGLRVASLTKAWALGPRPRPAFRTVLHTPLLAFWFELRGALRTVDWKRAGIYAGAGAGALLLLVLAVMTVADVTDDLKPARPVQTASGDSYTSAIVARAHAGKHAGPRRAAAAPQAAPLAQLEAGDLEFSTGPATRAATKDAPAAGPAKTKKKAAKAEVFIP